MASDQGSAEQALFGQRRPNRAAELLAKRVVSRC